MSSERERNDRGRFVETVTPETVLAVIRQAGDPIVTAKEISEQLGCTSEAARQKLLRLQDQGVVARRKVGAGAVVWWLADEDHSTSTDAFDPTDPLFTDPITFSSGEDNVSQTIDEHLADAIAGERESRE